ncbi:MAG: zinc-binding dehydrogenase [Gemmatimonadaceae bacterium]|nr:zinc-binding dehydrogenase [Chitinophagaceae bacterium]
MKEKLAIKHVINGASEDTASRVLTITAGDNPTAVFDATGNLNAINNAFRFLAHGGRYVLVGLQKQDISFSHREFHKREATLMSSRNATRADFEHVIDSMKKGLVDPASFITHDVKFDQVATEFASWLEPANAVVKAMIHFD